MSRFFLFRDPSISPFYVEGGMGRGFSGRGQINEKTEYITEVD